MFNIHSPSFFGLFILNFLVSTLTLFLFMCVYVCLCGSVHLRVQCPRRPGEGTVTPGGGVTGGSELTSVGSGYQTLVPSKNS